MNTIDLVGRLVKKPELLTSSQGHEWCKFTVACERRFYGKGEKKTDFIECVANRSAKYVCDYGDKGSLVHVIGELQLRKVVGNDGSAKTYSAIHVIEVTLLSFPEKGNVAAPNPYSEEYSSSETVSDAFIDPFAEE